METTTVALSRVWMHFAVTYDAYKGKAMVRNSRNKNFSIHDRHDIVLQKHTFDKHIFVLTFEDPTLLDSFVKCLHC